MINKYRCDIPARTKYDKDFDNLKSEKELEVWASVFKEYKTSYRNEWYKHVFGILLQSNTWMSIEDLEKEYGMKKRWQAGARSNSPSNQYKDFPFHKWGRQIRYKREEIEAWIEKHKMR